MKGIAVLGGIPATLYAFTAVSGEAGILAALGTGALFWLGHNAERDETAASIPAAPAVIQEPEPDTAIDELAFELSAAVERDGPAVMLAPGWYVVRGTDLPFEVVRADAPGAVEIHPHLDQARFQQWRDFWRDDDEDLDVLLPDEDGWSPAEDTARRVLANLPR